MAVTTIAGKEVHVDHEGFMTEYDEWDEEIAPALAANIGIDQLTEDHWQVIKYLRSDYQEQGETATLRRVSTYGGVTTKQLFQLFPKKPAKKMSYVSGLPKPAGCV
jgi:tRNA 2-thiouridine synthesizing protein E